MSHPGIGWARTWADLIARAARMKTEPARRRGVLRTGTISQSYEIVPVPFIPSGRCAFVFGAVCAHRGEHHVDEMRRGLARRAAVERRLRVVLDRELDGLRIVVAAFGGEQRKTHVDARRHAGAGDDFSLTHDALLRVARAERLEPRDARPVGRRFETFEDSGRTEDQRS